jgi:CRISPR-associated protein Cas2
MIYMGCYDISGSKSRARVHKVMKSYGIRVQYSFFQCDIDENIMEKMKNRVLKELDLEQDYFFIYPLCSKCTKKAIIDGKGELVKLESFFII